MAITIEKLTVITKELAKQLNELEEGVTALSQRIRTLEAEKIHRENSDSK